MSGLKWLGALEAGPGALWLLFAVCAKAEAPLQPSIYPHCGGFWASEHQLG